MYAQWMRDNPNFDVDEEWVKEQAEAKAELERQEKLEQKENNKMSDELKVETPVKEEPKNDLLAGIEQMTAEEKVEFVEGANQVFRNIQRSRYDKAQAAMRVEYVKEMLDPALRSKSWKLAAVKNKWRAAGLLVDKIDFTGLI